MVCCCVCVQDQEIAVIEQLGRWKSFKGPGINCICWPLQEVVGKVSLVMRELDVTCETKTKDNVFVNVVVSVQYRAILEKVYEAYYKLGDPRAQIESCVLEEIQSELPKMELVESFSSKDTLANKVKDRLGSTMADYGYHIETALVTDISAGAKVIHSAGTPTIVETCDVLRRQLGLAEAPVCATLAAACQALGVPQEGTIGDQADRCRAALGR